jgi:hypothetical protein
MRTDKRRQSESGAHGAPYKFASKLFAVPTVFAVLKQKFKESKSKQKR